MMHFPKLLPAICCALSLATFSTLPGTAQTAPNNTSPGTSGNPMTPMQKPSAPGTQMTPGGSMQQRASLNASDRQFMMKAAQSDMNEIMTSQLALKRASSTKVKSFAQMMIQ